MGIRKQAANLLTLCRLLGGLGLLALPALTASAAARTESSLSALMGASLLLNADDPRIVIG